MKSKKIQTFVYHTNKSIRKEERDFFRGDRYILHQPTKIIEHDNVPCALYAHNPAQGISPTRSPLSPFDPGGPKARKTKKWK
jgi:hypothetical protein